MAAQKELDKVKKIVTSDDSRAVRGDGFASADDGVSMGCFGSGVQSYQGDAFLYF